MTKAISYSDAGVSIETANEAVKRIGELAQTTFNNRTLTNIGSFGGMFDAKFPEVNNPILVSSADGVGTKLKIAFESGIHNTIGEDLVNHCVNDILVQGARPLFFMDYFATGVLSEQVTEAVVVGLAKACRENGCVLLGGETAEMPGFYPDGEYDLAGFIVGLVDKENVIDGSKIVAGDVVLGIPSSGLHTNGYSLARKLFFEIGDFGLGDIPDDLEDKTVGEVLISPHKSYLRVLDGLLEGETLKGLAHITGGGLYENVPRILPSNVSVRIERGAWKVPPVFSLMQALGNVEDLEMYRTFNMGIGMVVICSEADKTAIIEHIEANGEKCFEIGKVTVGDGSLKVE
ncbi:MAG: phosphoribosylformylglycinamidine cyclo-ligase [Pyrinomonadaceae bacterium]